MTSIFELMWEALQDTTLVILMISAVISIIFGATLSKDKSVDWIEGVAILVAVFTVATVTAVTDSQKDRQFRDLQAKQVLFQSRQRIKSNLVQAQSNAAQVIRGGQQVTINSHDLVVRSVSIV